MPFDAMVATRQQAISEALGRHGLTPVPWTFLAAHKETQLRRFGPSFWYRYRSATALLLVAASPIVGLLVAALHDFTGNGTALAIGSGLAWLCLAAALTGTGLIRLRAGSHWRERWAADRQLGDLGVPDTIAAVARMLVRETPGATLTLGELMREEVVLDPYLLIECGDECVCLGIWQNEHVIACAEAVDGVTATTAGG